VWNTESIWTRIGKAFEGLTWLFAGIFGGLIIGMPLWMILLGWI